MSLKYYLEILFFLIWAIGSRAFLFFRPHRKTEFKKILFINTAKIGDSICMTPIFREIKQHQPDFKINLLTSQLNFPIFEFNPHINQLINIDQYKESLLQKIKLVKLIKKENYDWVINLNLGPFNNLIGILASIKNRVSLRAKGLGFLHWLTTFFNNHNLFYKRKTLLLDTYLKTLSFLNIQTTNRKKEIFLDESIFQATNKLLDQLGIDNQKINIVISVCAGNDLKNWDLNKFAQLADWLVQIYYARIIFIGQGKKENEKVVQVINLMQNKKDVVNLSNKLSLKELFYLMLRMNLFIGLDTGPLYIANAFDVPVVDILGPVDEFSQPPIYEKCVIVKKNIACQPCSFILPAAHKCREGHPRCLKEISVDDVKQAVMQIIKKYQINL